MDLLRGWSARSCALDQMLCECVTRYVEAFDQETMLEMTRVVSAEGAALVEAQTSALFGDLKLLQRQMQVQSPLQKLARLRSSHDA